MLCIGAAVEVCLTQNRNSLTLLVFGRFLDLKNIIFVILRIIGAL